MILGPDTYILAIWFLEYPSNFNWMSTAHHDGDKNWNWKITYRFRYYKDNKIFESADERSWTEVELPQDTTESEIIVKSDLIARLIAEPLGVQFERLIVRGDAMKMAAKAKAKKLKWLHCREDVIPISKSVH